MVIFHRDCLPRGTPVTLWDGKAWFFDGNDLVTVYQERTMKILSIVLLPIFMSLLMSCSTGQIVAKSALVSSDPDAATVTVIRKSQMTGSGGNVEVHLDGDLIALIAAGEVLKLKVPPGEHFVEVAVPTNAITGLFTKREDMTEVVRFNAKPKQKYYFLYSISIGNEMYKLKQLTEDEAKKELSEEDYEMLNAK